MNNVISNLARWFSSLPGIGPKTAEKLAYAFLRMPADAKDGFVAAMRASATIRRCQKCQNFSSDVLCDICRDQSRNQNLLCVVSDPQDVSVIERTKKFTGLYHVLHGLIAPLEGVTAESLKIKLLLERISSNGIQEVILAFDQTMQGETTVSHLSKLLKDRGVKVTVLGRGVPTGADIEYADELTLGSALEGRKEI